MPSVIKVRSKKAAASWYSRVALPVWTAVMSAANSDCWKVPSRTSRCGTVISLQGFMVCFPYRSNRAACFSPGTLVAADSMALQLVMISL